MISLISLMQLNGLMNMLSNLPPEWDWSLSSGCLFLTQFMSQKNSPHYHLSLELIQPSPTVLCPLSVKKNQENKGQKSF